jgi:hypothetical protein
MNKVTCTKCNGNGLYNAPTSHGPYCFACKGTGMVAPRKARAAKVITLSPMVAISSLCGGRPMRDFSAATLAYLGLTSERSLELADLWDAGVREVARA